MNRKSRANRRIMLVLLWLSHVAAGCDGAVDSTAMELDVTIIRDESGCDTCLAFSEESVIGAPDGPAAFENAGLIVGSDSLGRRFVFSQFGTQVKVFTEDGTFVDQVGQRGSGPGEFRMISTIDVEEGGTLHVHDAALGTRTTYTPMLDLKSSTLLEIRPSGDVVALRDGKLLIASSIATPDLAEFPLHIVSAEGRLERSFGAVTGEFDALSTSTLRVLAVSGDTAVWVAHRNRYRIELWDITSVAEAPLLTIERQVPWFPPGAEDTDSTEEPPAPGVVDIQATDDGMVMTLLRVPDARWAESVQRSSDHGHKQITDPHGYFDTVVEVLNPQAGTVEAAVRRPEMLVGFAGPGLLWAVNSDAIGIPTIQFLTVEFQQ